jgi:signal transduction histidine kinase
VILGFSTWAVGGFAAGTGPFFVLLYVWVGLHHPPIAVVLLAPLATAAYVWPLVATHRPPNVVSSAIVLIPVATTVGVIIARRVLHLRRARDEISRGEQWRASMMVALAHDVRSPLTSVQAALELLDDGALPTSERRAVAAAALRQTARIKRLAAGLLDLDRVEHGRLRLDLRALRLSECARLAVGYVAASDVDIDIADEVWVCADPDRLEQIVINLVTNALRHGTPPVLVSADLRGECVQLCVRDHGRALSADEQATLFRRFGTEPTPESTGLGLWIVQQLAQAHGGDVRYEPAEPGARFVVTLPRVVPRDSRREPTGESRPTAATTYSPLPG